MMYRLALLQDNRGTSAVEFAMIAPVMLMTLFGMFDIGHAQYTRALLEGRIERASRAATIEGASTSSIDARLTAAVKQVAPGATITFKRTSLTDFSDLGLPEDFDDINKDGLCNDNEPFEDSNGNNSYDVVRGKSGNGAARDVILYQVEVRYKRILPIGRLIGQSDTMKIDATTVLRNQPFGVQNYAEWKHCT